MRLNLRKDRFATCAADRSMSFRSSATLRTDLLGSCACCLLLLLLFGQPSTFLGELQAAVPSDVGYARITDIERTDGGTVSERAGDIGAPSKPASGPVPQPSGEGSGAAVKEGLPQAAPVPAERISEDIAWPDPQVPLNAPYSPEVLYEKTYLNKLGGDLATWKTENGIPITLGAWHWWHVNNNGPFDSGYGISGLPGVYGSPDLNGTYYYYIQAAPEISLGDSTISKVGAYTDVRLRDGGDRLRPFFPDETVWLDSAYVWALTPQGVFKAGSILKRFGLEWDGSWWGSVQYFDGFKLDTDWGVAWERTPLFVDGFKMDSYVQFFFHENSVNGTLVGSDAESVIGSSERNTLVARCVPTWQLSDTQTVAVGISGLVGQIENDPILTLARTTASFPSSGDETIAAWAVDLTATSGKFEAHAELMQSFGRLSPARYVSGGPSSRLTSFLVGCSYTLGPLTGRVNYSAGFDDKPAGTHTLFVPGLTLRLTRNVELWAEYVREDVHGNAASDSLVFEDGFQLLVHWTL